LSCQRKMLEIWPGAGVIGFFFSFFFVIVGLLTVVMIGLFKRAVGGLF